MRNSSSASMRNSSSASRKTSLHDTLLLNTAESLSVFARIPRIRHRGRQFRDWFEILCFIALAPFTLILVLFHQEIRKRIFEFLPGWSFGSLFLFVFYFFVSIFNVSAGNAIANEESAHLTTTEIWGPLCLYIFFRSVSSFFVID